MKRFLYYFIWTMAIGLVLYVGMYFQQQLTEWSKTPFNLFPLQVYIALFPVAIGLLLRTPKFLLQFKNGGPWSFDWILFTAVGLPALYLVLMAFLPFSSLGEGWLPIPALLIVGGTTVSTVAGLVFGYSVLASFKESDAGKSVGDL
ncbi:hypothetical protein HF394_17645 [Planococcus glaciei]|uniref:Uncharacterized protein n=1 Tax=Planococcus glaciei TaxID=459472 RepID=A0A7H8QFJ4_9BACL|nr:hypothetical protein [Planococcus glaciei]QDY46597.1 hypothetical protein FK545_18400 [Planococcus glaciei]QKX52251.1 hypothetical protein HF394_17645 [Planococcus glaciei]